MGKGLDEVPELMRGAVFVPKPGGSVSRSS